MTAKDTTVVCDVRLGVTILTIGTSKPIRIFHDNPQVVQGEVRVEVVGPQANHPDAEKPDAPWEPLRPARRIQGDALVDVQAGETWKNNLYTVFREVMTYPEGDPNGIPTIHLSIRRNDRLPVTDWRHKQKIKNQLVGEECEGIELYPAESRLIDSSNQFHLWCLPDPDQRIPMGYKDGRIVFDGGVPGMETGQQRPFVDGEEQTITEEQRIAMGRAYLERGKG